MGCRGKGDRSVLLRLVVYENDGFRTVVLDRHRRMSGRGLWLHPDEHCLVLAVSRSAFARALRLTGPHDASQVVGQVRAMLQDGAPSPGPASEPADDTSATETDTTETGTTDREQNADEHPMSTQR